MTVPIRCTVNGQPVEAQVADRTLLSDWLRHEQRLTGTHVGCEHGVCGACTVLVDGEAVRSCLTLAAQVDEHARAVCQAGARVLLGGRRGRRGGGAAYVVSERGARAAHRVERASGEDRRLVECSAASCD